MKRLLFAVVAAVAVASFTSNAYSANERGTAKINLKGKMVSVEYGRPSLNGRKVNDLLGELPNGEVWRLGADKSTTLTTSADLNFGGVTVPKGVYSLWAQKESNDNWKLVFNKQHGQWGTKHDAAQDLTSVPLTIEKPGQDKNDKAEKPPEKFTVTLENEKGMGEISFEWGTLELVATFK